MRHRRDCTGTARLDRQTHVGSRQLFIFRCDTCAAVELRHDPKGN